MEEILKKNLINIAMHNKSLCDKILSVRELSKQLEISSNLAGEYNLLINGKPVHSITDINKESENLFEQLNIDKNLSIHFIYGLGLGYLSDKYIEKAKGRVVVYEPDIETLYYVLSAVDFSENFKTGRLYFASSYDEFDNILNLLFRYKTNVTVSYLDYYKLYHKSEVETFTEFVQNRVQLIDHNFTFQVTNCFSFFSRTLENVAKKFLLPMLTDYKDAFKGKPALIVSAGPSLNKNIELIKKYQDNAIIFCVGTALGTLYNNGITPDFVNVIERNNTKVLYDFPFSKDINFICETFTESSYLNIDFKQKLLTASIETDDARWFLEKAGRELVHFETKGTVAYHALYSAYYLGCDPIILIGQDLAYTDGRCYAKGSKFEGLECIFDEDSQKYKIVLSDYEKFKEAYCSSFADYPEEVKDNVIKERLQELNKNLHMVKGQNNNLLPTEGVYSLFIEYIKNFASRYKSERTLINSSIGGALIEGFEVIPLETAINKFAPAVFDKKALIDSVKFQPKIQLEKIIFNLKDDIKVLNEALLKLQKGTVIAANLKKELDRSRIYTSKAIDMTIKLSAIYTDLTNNYMLKNRAVKISMLTQYSNVNYLNKEHTSISDYSVACEYACAYLDYFNNNIININATIYFITLALKELEEINEGSNTKS